MLPTAPVPTLRAFQLFHSSNLQSTKSGEKFGTGDSIFPASPEMASIPIGREAYEADTKHVKLCLPPTKAASRWLQTSNAWMDIWKKRGRAPESLQKTLSKAQAGDQNVLAS